MHKKIMDTTTRIIQSRMQSKLLQISHKTNDIETAGGLIIQELKRQEHQMDDINNQLDHTSCSLSKSKELVQKGYGTRISPLSSDTETDQFSILKESNNPSTVYIELEKRSLFLGKTQWRPMGIYDRSMIKLTSFSEFITEDPMMTLTNPFGGLSSIQDSHGWIYAVRADTDDDLWGKKRWSSRYRRRTWILAKNPCRRNNPMGKILQVDHRNVAVIGMDDSFTMNCMISDVRSNSSQCSNPMSDFDRVIDDIANGLHNIDHIAKEIRAELIVHGKKVNIMEKKINDVLETEILLVSQMH